MSTTTETIRKWTGILRAARNRGDYLTVATASRKLAELGEGVEGALAGV